MPILIATRSAGKRREIIDILHDCPGTFTFPEDLGLAESPDEARLESAATFHGNARAKAEYFAQLTGLPTAADDSGLEVVALDGQPGVRSKRFAPGTRPPHEQDAANNTELLRRLAGVSTDRRRARYRCVVVYLASSQAPAVAFEGRCDGTIVEMPRGRGGFGYDPLFLSDEIGKTFGEATAAEKHAVSHRGRAFRAFARWLGTQLPP